jgi:hypothetical protein
VVTKNECTKPTFSPKTSEQIVVTFVGTQAWSHQDRGEPPAAYAKGSSQLRWLPEGYGVCCQHRWPGAHEKGSCRVFRRISQGAASNFVGFSLASANLSKKLPFQYCSYLKCYQQIREGLV